MEHLILCLVFGVVLGIEPFIDEPPPSVLTIQGDTILLRCGVGQHVTATLSWQNMENGDVISEGLVVDPDLNLPSSTRARFSIVGNRANGEYHLQIRDVVGDDGGRYTCYYYDASTQTEHLSKIATVTVMIPPAKGYPVCTMDPTFGRIGEIVTLICESQGGNPPAALTWTRDKDILFVKYAPNEATSMNRISILLTEEDMDVEYTCLARNPATKQPPSCSVKPLRTTIDSRVYPSILRAASGQHAIFNCISEDLPGLAYTWYVNTRPVDNTHERYSVRRGGKRFKLYPVLPSDDLSMVTCVVEQPATNISSSDSALLRVNLQGNPKTTLTPVLTTSTHLPDVTYHTTEVTIPRFTTKESFQTTTVPVRTTNPVSTQHATDDLLVTSTVMPLDTTDTNLLTSAKTKTVNLCQGATCNLVTKKYITNTYPLTDVDNSVTNSSEQTQTITEKIKPTVKSETTQSNDIRRFSTGITNTKSLPTKDPTTPRKSTTNQTTLTMSVAVQTTPTNTPTDRTTPTKSTTDRTTLAMSVTGQTSWSTKSTTDRTMLTMLMTDHTTPTKSMTDQTHQTKITTDRTTLTKSMKEQSRPTVSTTDRTKITMTDHTMPSNSTTDRTTLTKPMTGQTGPTKSTTDRTTITSTNILCEGVSCNGIIVTPPREYGPKYGKDHDVSMTLMLSLALICFFVIVLIIALLMLKRSAAKKRRQREAEPNGS